jgi:hypothetical protein
MKRVDSATDEATQGLPVIQARWRQANPARRLALALVTCLVIFGLLNLPVECAVATGPHSMFLSAASVAELQHAAEPQASATGSRSHGRALPVQQAGVRDAAMSATMPDMGGMQNAPSHEAPPTPAGFASNAVPLRLTSGPQQGPRLGGVSLPISTHVSEPSGQLQTGPEPPPPNAA